MLYYIHRVEDISEQTVRALWMLLKVTQANSNPFFFLKTFSKFFPLLEALHLEQQWMKNGIISILD